MVPLAQGCEELEAVTIIDLLVRAGVQVVTVSLDDNLVITASRGVKLVADSSIDNVDAADFDMVVLPGGLPGANHLNDSVALRNFLTSMSMKQALIGAICAAPKVLVSAGLLDNKKATSFPGHIDKVPAENMTYLEEAVVIDGNIITSRGPGTAMDFALTLIELLVGSEAKKQVEAGLLRP
ncbi:DJ-1 family glyoxalase III [Hydrogenovibrio sp. JE_KL2]|uniref:DJ-1 family glyoxalase III n=1 Tax=Hydrogenovibrio sp. JE_KL2 TaxID=2651188 RepID=UPI0020A59C18|nr:DJ-1 family glyoxalase III [Hydrogenovibrio sp. JE_KL2]